MGLSRAATFVLTAVISLLVLAVPSAQAATTPTATTEAASEVTVPSVTLNASINPNDAATQYQFEYGTSTAYGSSVPAVAKSVGSGTSTVSVSRAIGEIEPKRVYHFRIRASNAFGTSYGKDEIFSYWGSWTLESPPNPAYADASYLSGVSCPSASNCLAVGHSSASEGKSIAEHWNGEAWSLASGGADRYPLNVSCGSATVCWAVGTQGSANEVLVERYEEAGKWKGSAYTTHTPIVPEGATNLHLNAIACTSSTECTAAGYYYKEGHNNALVEHLTSSGWSVQTTPEIVGAVLEDISCTSTSACMVVGSEQPSGKPRSPLAESWNGSAWSTVSVEALKEEAKVEERWFSSVSCTSSSACTATGHFSNAKPTAAGPLVAHYTGTEFALSTLPKLNEYSTLEDVSCASSSACLATGHNAEGGGTLAVAWNGTEWATQSSPTPEGKTAYLSGVACPEALACVAVGKAVGGGETATLAERLGGSWTLESPPNPAYADASYLSGVSCPSASNCLAVGHSSASEGKSIAEHWNGEAWSLASGGADRYPLNVSCGSATVCWAVGTQGSANEVLVERYEEAGKWKGSAYTTHTPIVPEGATNLHLNAIACTSSTECTAAGYYYKEGHNNALVEHLTSSGWSVQTTPEIVGAVLEDISCTSTSACMVVGSEQPSGKPRSPLAESWNGSAWSTVSVEALKEEAKVEERWFSSVSCTSSSACTATGHFSNAKPTAAGPLVAHYTGTEFALSTLPKLNEYSTLENVSCASSSACLATGHNAEGGGTLAVAWNGTEWATQSSPTPEGKTAYLSGVACPEALACVAVGKAVGGGETATLAERLELNPPGATTSTASEVGAEEATLNGTVDTNGSESTYSFEYGTSTAYGSSAPAEPESLSGSTTPTAVSQLIAALHDGTTYHYRLVARSAAGTALGADQTLTTVDLPQTTITSPTPSYTSHEISKVDFESDKSGSTFKCGLDEGEKPTKSCTSPYALPEHLSEGWHTFVVAAKDSEGIEDATPAKWTFNTDIYPSAPSTSKLLSPDEGAKSGLLLHPEVQMGKSGRRGRRQLGRLPVEGSKLGCVQIDPRQYLLDPEGSQPDWALPASEEPENSEPLYFDVKAYAEAEGWEPIMEGLQLRAVFNGGEKAAGASAPITTDLQPLRWWPGRRDGIRRTRRRLTS